MDVFSTAETAQKAGVHKDTLLRWLRAGLIPEPSRDRRGWRVFSIEEAETIVRFARYETKPAERPLHETSGAYNIDRIANLQRLDWDFVDAVTDYLSHGLHPYPAKFIPQIPNALIQELSSVGDTVLDIFCGSGTTLVESLLLKRNAMGIDANPLACLVSRAKTLRLSDTDELALRSLESALDEEIVRATSEQIPLFSSNANSLYPERPANPQIEFWFEPFVIDELTSLRALCNSVPTETARTLALASFSSIVVTVSRQDSDTRYVRRHKDIYPGDATKRFKRTLSAALTNAQKFTDATEPRFVSSVQQANVLDGPELSNADLMVCSPPYPNAYSYHLYHMTRMLWLGMDQPTFKKNEIGSHRKYSRKGVGRATAETFRNELRTILHWLRFTLKRNKYACFVIGDSIIRGEVIRNSDLLIDVAKEEGYRCEGLIARHLQSSRKSFNPAIGKIKQEHIVILRNSEGKNG